MKDFETLLTFIGAFTLMCLVTLFIVGVVCNGMEIVSAWQDMWRNRK